MALMLLATLAPPVAAKPPDAPAVAPGQGKSDRGLGKEDRARVAEAVAAGKKTVTLLIAAERGRLDEAAADIRALGGKVLATDETVEYLKIEVPVARADEAAAVDAVAAVDVDGLIPLDDPRPDGAENPLPQTPPSAATPRINPYMPIADTGAAQFTAANPTWDGRGVLVAVLDSGVDLDHPSLATTSTGENKIVDWYNANASNSGDGTWVNTTGRFNGTFTANAATWIAPATGGPYSFGRLRETTGDLAAGELGGDIDRDGITAEFFGVLQDRSTRRVYVDLDQDGDFTDQTSMIDFKVARDFQYFGTDNPATAVKEAVPFVVVTDRSNQDPASEAASLVNIGIAGAAHGSHVSGIIAAHAMFGGAMSGAAPGAKLMAVKVCLTTTACTSSGLIDGVLYAANNGADIVNISIGGLPALNDGNNARAELYNRTIDDFNMQIVISAGNSGAGGNTVGDPSVATNSISVGSYITDDTWLSNYGSVAANATGLHPFSSRGPREDGGFKPTIVAPGAAVSTVPTWQNGQPVAGTYILPPGYGMFNGTSMAAPQTVGGGALLISAYKATHGGARPTAAALRNAIVSSATYQANLGAYEQGTGLLTVGAAWTLLNAGVSTRNVSGSVPVSTVLSGLLATPNVGVGIHDREGVVQGVNYVRTYTLTRTTGPSKAITFNLKWLGNDGTFKARGGSSKVLLPLNIPVLVDVDIRPSTAGIHSAILQLDDPTTVGIDYMTMNTVVVPNEFSAANSYTVSMSGSVGRNATKHLFVRVPAGASALKVDLTGGGATPGAGQIRFLRFTPQGLGADANASTNCYNPDAGAGCSTGSPTSRTQLNPLPGVWEILVEARRTSDALQSPFSVTVSIQGAQISPNPDVVPSAQIGVPQTRDYTITNLFAAFTGRLVGGGALSSTQTQRPTVAHLGQTDLAMVTIPANVTRYQIRTLNAQDPRSDIDLFVYRCNPTCVLVGAGTSATSVETVTLNNPAAGQYLIQLDGFSVPDGTSEIDVIDSWTSATLLGTVTSTDVDALRPAGSSWAAQATLSVLGDPGAGRKITGTLSVVTDGGTTVGAGSIVVEAVTP